MTRAADLRLRLEGTEARTSLDVFTYDGTVAYAQMRESVYLQANFEGGHTNHELTPAEARQLAKHLVAVAEVCERARNERHADEDLEEQLRDPDSAINQGYATVVHNGVVYGMRPTEAGH